MLTEEDEEVRFLSIYHLQQGEIFDIHGTGLLISPASSVNWGRRGAPQSIMEDVGSLENVRRAAESPWQCLPRRICPGSREIEADDSNGITVMAGHQVGDDLPDRCARRRLTRLGHYSKNACRDSFRAFTRVRRPATQASLPTFSEQYGWE